MKYIVITAYAAISLWTHTNIANAADTPKGPVPTLLPPGPLHTMRSQIVDRFERPVRLTCVGLNSPNPAARPIDAQFQLMVASGFNCIRMPIVNARLDAGLATIDPWVAGAGKVGIRVIIDNHTNEEGHGPQDNWGSQQKNGLWYDVGGGSDDTDGGGNRGTVSDTKFLQDWVKVARHYAGNDTVIGYDLRNEPTPGYRGRGASWGDGSERDIRAMYQRVGNAILEVDPNKLVIVEGVMNYGTRMPEGDLRVVASRPVELNVPNHVVYSVHIYPKEISGYSPDSGEAAIQRWNTEWGYLITKDIAPVWVGEMGSSMLGADARAWAETLVPYLNGTAPGGLRIPPGGQKVGTDWWAWGHLGDETPNGTLNADWLTSKPEQAEVYGLLTQAPVGPPVADPPMR